MLVQFMLKNVLSFKDETILDMTAVNAYKEHASNLIDLGNKEKILRVAAVYGANASGKSNLYLAMHFFQEIIKKSLDNVDDGSKTAIAQYYFPFFFEEKIENSELQIIEMIGDDEYRYGFEYNAECVVAEWLYRKNTRTNRTSIIFERTVHTVNFGASVRKECDVYKEQIPAETLVLTFFNRLKLKTEVFKDVYNRIAGVSLVSTNFLEKEGFLETILPTVINKDKGNLTKFLAAIDTGIKDIGYIENDKQIKFYTTHVGSNGYEYLLDLYSESEGTIKSIKLYICAKSAIILNSLIFVDELNLKLHPLLLKFIVDLFYENDSKAQLIYTTHDTTLMDKKFFRRDQIWFVQKDEFGYSELTALSDFKVRSDASFEKDYLAGVYGGVPLIKEFEWKEDE